MKIVFLDIDGVMNSTQSWEQSKQLRALGHIEFKGSNHNYFPVWSVLALNRITDETGALIVVSSSWRDDLDYCRHWLRKWGVTAPIIDRTPGGYDKRTKRCDGGRENRGDEIDDWLRTFACAQSLRRRRTQVVTHHVILDDDDPDYWLQHPNKVRGQNWVRTDYANSGLTDAHAARAIEILSQ